MCEEFVKLFKRQERRHAWEINKQISFTPAGNSIMLTIFAIPKPFRGHIGVIQRNAICSWLELRQACEIILLGDDEGTAEGKRTSRCDMSQKSNEMIKARHS
jgi:hypothetical protein